MASSSFSRPEILDRRLFVSRLAPYTKKEKLMEIFHPYGVEHVVVLRKTSGNNAFVTFKSIDGAKKALAAADVGIICHKRKLRVLMADSWHSTKLIPPRPDVNPFPGFDLRERIPLPIECISKIANYLPFADRSRLEMVSRRWRLGSLASYHGLRHIDLNDWCWPNGWEGTIVSTKSFYWFLKRAGSQLKSIRIDEEPLAKCLRPQVISIAIRSCPELQAIDLTAVTIRPSTLRDLESGAPRLTCLKLGKCEGPVDPELFKVLALAGILKSFCLTNTDITGKSLPAINKNLETFSLHRCEQLKPSNLATTLQGLRNLNYLKISICKNLIDHSILQALINNSDLQTTLTTLELHFCGFEEPMPEMEMEEGNEAVERGDFAELELGPVEMAVSFPSKYRSITTLSLTFCGWVASGLVSEIGLYMGEVTSLNLSGCTNIKGEFVLEPLRKLEKLKILNINYMHPTVGGWMLQFLKGLVEVHCRESQGITDEDICGLLRQCPEIVTIDVESCPTVSKTVLDCAYEVVTLGERTGPIHL
ncbi:uncharacterized protein LOC143378246, partial [Andrena cerasifolii]|uniref:uncharacterized protein LOC143378246 n=1 Tax=Andrena cerasifolii TaxID=2819439 RepID=UPI00403832E4